MKRAIIYTLIAFGLLALIPSISSAYRLWTSGFELQSLTAGEEFTSSGLGGGWGSINTTAATSSAVHSGSASFFNHPTTAAFSWLGNIFRADGATAKAWVRTNYYYEVNTATNPIEILAFWDSVAVNRRAAVVITSGGVGQLLTDDNSQIGSNSSALSANTWYCVQLMAFSNGAGASEISGSIETGECTSSPSTFASSAVTTIADFNAVYIGTPSASAVFGAYWDDMAINDAATTNGSTEVSFPGAGKIVYLRPTASGDTAATLGGFGDIDETDPNNATDFIDLDAATSIGCYNTTDTSGLIDSYDTVKLVDVGIRIREEASAVTSYQFGWKSQASGKVASSTANDAGDTTWRTNQTGTTAMTNRMATTTDPQDNGTISTTELDNGQICAASLDVDDIDVSTLWLEVEYTDGSPPAAGVTYPSLFFFE